MPYLKNSFSVFIFIIGFAVNVSGQYKYEVESRINPMEVPEKARIFIDRCGFKEKIKWYEEESLEGKSFECKSKLRNLLFSIEFDTLGGVLDVEYTASLKQLDEDVRKAIDTNLDSLFIKYKVLKMQIHWQGADDVLINLVTTGETNKTFTLKYEIEIKAKKQDFSKFYQVLFNRKGQILEVLEMIQRRTENLEF